MSKLGFKFSWETNETEEKQDLGVIQTQQIISGGAIDVIQQLQDKIQNYNNFILTNEFATLPYEGKEEVVNTFKFFTALMATFQGPINNGVNVYPTSEQDIM
jgi:hypothetical protein